MKQFELQTPVSQLFSALKAQSFACELFSDRLFRTIERNPLSHNFCDIITLELYYVYIHTCFGFKKQFLITSLHQITFISYQIHPIPTVTSVHWYGWHYKTLQTSFVHLFKAQINHTSRLQNHEKESFLIEKITLT